MAVLTDSLSVLLNRVLPYRGSLERGQVSGGGCALRFAGEGPCCSPRRSSPPSTNLRRGFWLERNDLRSVTRIRLGARPAMSNASWMLAARSRLEVTVKTRKRGNRALSNFWRHVHGRPAVSEGTRSASRSAVPRALWPDRPPGRTTLRYGRAHMPKHGVGHNTNRHPHGDAS